MKQVPIEAVQPRFYQPQPRVLKKHWPYRAQARPAKLGGLDTLDGPEFNPQKCAKCGGQGRVWVQKNPRTGSQRNISCPAHCKYAL